CAADAGPAGPADACAADAGPAGTADAGGRGGAHAARRGFSASGQGGDCRPQRPAAAAGGPRPDGLAEAPDDGTFGAPRGRGDRIAAAGAAAAAARAARAAEARPERSSALRAAAGAGAPAGQ